MMGQKVINDNFHNLPAALLARTNRNSSSPIPFPSLPTIRQILFPLLNLDPSSITKVKELPTTCPVLLSFLAPFAGGQRGREPAITATVATSLADLSLKFQTMCCKILPDQGRLEAIKATSIALEDRKIYYQCSCLKWQPRLNFGYINRTSRIAINTVLEPCCLICKIFITFHLGTNHCFSDGPYVAAQAS
jgi:hypothetical protein